MLNALHHGVVDVVWPLELDRGHFFNLNRLSFVMPIQAIFVPVIRVFMCVSAGTSFAHGHR
jgi:hypothetical protein